MQGAMRLDTGCNASKKARSLLSGLGPCGGLHTRLGGSQIEDARAKIRGDKATQQKKGNRGYSRPPFREKRIDWFSSSRGRWRTEPKKIAGGAFASSIREAKKYQFEGFAQENRLCSTCGRAEQTQGKTECESRKEPSEGKETLQW